MKSPVHIGIVGGSFDPVHIAHLIMADRFIEQMELDECWFVPAFRSPFKPGEEFYRDVTPEERLEMMTLAAGLHPKFRVEDVELRRGGISYSIDTIDFFREKFPDASIFLLIGTDQAHSFRKWKSWEDILAKVQLCIVRRPGSYDIDEDSALSEQLSVGGKSPEWISAPLLEISATDIRKRIAEGRSVRFILPENVEEYIRTRNLYRKA